MKHKLFAAAVITAILTGCTGLGINNDISEMIEEWAAEVRAAIVSQTTTLTALKTKLTEKDTEAEQKAKSLNETTLDTYYDELEQLLIQVNSDMYTADTSILTARIPSTVDTTKFQQLYDEIDEAKTKLLDGNIATLIATMQADSDKSKYTDLITKYEDLQKKYNVSGIEAKFIEASKTYGSKWAEKKPLLKDNNSERTPMLILPVYGNLYYTKDQGTDKSKYQLEVAQEQRIYSGFKAGTIQAETYQHHFEGGLSPQSIWSMVPENLRKYCVVQFHENNRSNQNPAGAKTWYDDMLAWSDENGVPALITISAAEAADGAYNLNHYGFNHIEPTHNDDRLWLLDMLKRHPSLKGFVSTEHHWTGDVSAKTNEWVKFCAETNTVHFLFEGTGTLSRYFTNSIMTGTHQNGGTGAQVNNASEHFVLGFKLTNHNNIAECVSLSNGAWLAERSAAFGGLIDTWNWRREGLGIGFSYTTSSSVMQACLYPEGEMAAFMLELYMNGATIFNFEAPWGVYGNYNQQGLMLLNAIAPVFEWMISHPAPSREQVKTRYGIATQTQYAANDGGPNVAQANKELYDRGKQGLLPSVRSQATGQQATGQVKTVGAQDASSGATQKTPFGDTVFDNTVSGNVGELSRATVFSWPANDGVSKDNATTWLFFNNTRRLTDPKYNANPNQWPRQKAKVSLDGTSGSASVGTKWLEVEMYPYTVVAINRKSNNTLEIFINDYALKRGTAAEMGGGAQIWSHEYWRGWLQQRLTVGGSQVDYRTYRRNTVFTFGGCSNVTIAPGEKSTVDAEITVPTSCTESSGNKVLTVNGNGWATFTVSFN